MKPCIVVARTVPEAVAQRASQEFDALLAQDCIPTTDDLLARMHAHCAEGLLVGATVKLDADTIRKMPAQMKIVAALSAGFDQIDIDAAKARNLIVTNATDAPTDCTADMALMLMLCAARRAAEYHALMQAGWRRRPYNPERRRRRSGCRR